MRSEQEILRLVLTLAKDDERVRAVILSGSRANPEAPRDIFQDYDLVFVVSSMDSFIRDRRWIADLGNLLIMQTPDEMGDPAALSSDHFAFLMLFQDGIRIDLTLHAVDQLPTWELDAPSSVLLDKDHIVDRFPSANWQRHKPSPPSAKQYADCCNEFWWVSTYVAKGLWRRELPYANSMFEGPVRHMLHRMLTWQIGVKTGFASDPGKSGKYFEKYLSPQHWTQYVRTIPDADCENVWSALFMMCDLFRETAEAVAQHFGYDYPWEDDKRVTAYLHRVRGLSRDAEGVF